MATPTPPQSILREFCPLYYLLNSIPEKVQKGFRSVLVYLTALDSSRDFIAVGSSIGVLYLYSRRLSHMDKHHIKGKSEAITAVKLLSCFDDLVAVGTASGRVTVFQLVSQLPGRNKQLRRFDVLGLHKSTVTCLAWSTNGAKLFSGDDKGRVVFTALELDKGECKPVIFLEEASGIVQLEYSHTVLLVCSQQRALFFSTQQQVLQQMGTKPRKSGRFGACFLPALCKQSDLQVLAARPGFRLWRADIQGLAEDAQLFKDLSSTPVPEFQLFPRPSTAGAYHPAERQLGLLSCFHRDGWLLSWNEYSVYVVDCLNEVVIGALESCGDIVAVSSCQNEVFILKGDRDIIRVSSCPEGQTPSSDSSAGLASPLTTPTVLSPPIGSVETAQPIRTMAIVMEKQDAGGGARSAGEEEEEEEPEEEEEEGVEGSARRGIGSRRDLQLLFLLPVGEHSPQRGSPQRGSTHSRSSSVTSWDSGSTSLTPDLSELGSKRYSASLDPEELQQELVVKAIRVKKRMRRGRKDSCSRRTVSDGGWSEPMAGVQDGAGSHGNPQTQQPLLEHRPPEPEPSRAQDLRTTSGSEAGPLSLPPLLLGDPPDPAVPPTPDVDLLLECSFSYLQASQDPPPGPDLLPNGEDDEEFLSPLIGPEEEEEEEDAAPPCGREDPLFHSTVSTLDPEASDEEEDIYRCSGAPPGGEPGYCRPGGPPGGPAEEDQRSPKGDQLAECWMGYPGPGCGILSLHVTDRYVWCLDFKGVLFCSPLPDGGLKWQRFEDNIHQVAVSPSGGLLWKVEQKTMTAYACGKVSIKGKRHWYKALDLTASVALSNNAAWILRTNGDLYLQTGLSAERPCARSVKVETPCSFSQVCARGGVVWALSEEGAVFYREGLSSYCCEGDSWRNDKISEAQGVQLMCVSLGPSGVVWALDASGALWFRTGVSPASPQGEDHHWWQISITDYVVFDQGSLFQTLLQATHSVATVTRTPVERVAECLRVAFLSQQAQCQPSLVSANPSGVWIASGRNHLHVARGNLVGTFWQNVVPRGTVSSTRWTFITTSVLPYRPGTFLWVAQSRKDLFCIWDQDGELRPSSVTLPPEVELSQLSACGDALWGLDTHGYVHIRTLSPTCPIGMHWARLDLSQLGGARLVSVSCGGQNVWAVDTQGMVYFRVGTQPLNPSMMLPAWICIEPPVQPVGVQLVSIHSSPNDRQLWALDNRGSVHVRTGLNEEMPVGTDWEQVPGLAASQLVLSVRTVWVRCPNGEIARRYGNTARNPAGDYWKRIPGMSHWLAVTPDDALWAVTVSGGLSHRLTKPLPHNPPADPAPPADDLEDEWEVI
ncbi:tectonin beta-propeller repeat-containing protein 2 [Gadus chalcogrammus]|uniref:tectonin beta-propeller repeat-containing protein 2 n=1 Tax=Gadus chalcogrammus TaxID=1042646 RepID=UPI0024C438BD|nr:tectonin beta-propeller repeat-containing protein 2 [Gadus chalcogrammus]